ncbi:MAG TPA: carboxypeptidase-like regulatory domain-containing protein, partial [Thermoanaerobaculia bacterium]|nr:carboxypeptidase-like regulatory domain-containing protein [Thermoanaerobaculia bacterium]
MRIVRALVLAMLACGTLVAGAAWAQNPTGTITGHVTGTDGSALPGVTVTVTSPSMQGERTTVSQDNGDYLVPLLPPGT